MTTEQRQRLLADVHAVYADIRDALVCLVDTEQGASRRNITWTVSTVSTVTSRGLIGWWRNAQP